MTRSASLTSSAIARRVEKTVEMPLPNSADSRRNASCGSVDNRDMGAHADSDRRRMRARDAAAEDEHVGCRHARHAAEQNAAPALRFLERMRADLRRKAAGDLGHRRQQRQAADGDVTVS